MNNKFEITETHNLIADELLKSLSRLEVEGEVTDIEPGLTVSRYIFSAAPGHSVDKLTQLGDELCCALQVRAIRIVGLNNIKRVVAFEIPNPQKTLISFEKLLNNDEFRNYEGRLPIIMGKAHSGQTIISDLARMPHLLIAGVENSEISMFLKTAILSLMSWSTSDDLKLILIKTNGPNLKAFKNSPFLFQPLVTEPRKAFKAFSWVLGELVRRLKLMEALKVRNLDDYNRKIAERTQVSSHLSNDHLGDSHLPRIVILVEELADLTRAGNDTIVEALEPIAFYGRTPGIHLVLATQRINKSVLSGLLKALLPTRISFSVLTENDSRLILDTGGAESLLGNGDMLFRPPGTYDLQRIQAGLVTDAEVLNILGRIRR